MSREVFDIAVVGSLNADRVLEVDRFPRAGEAVAARSEAFHFGGKGANQAFAAARLGARVAMLGRVGGDAEGERLTANLAEAGVDVSWTRRLSDCRSGSAIVFVQSSGENRAIVAPGANGRYDAEALGRDVEVLARSRFVLTQLETTLSATLEALRIGRRRGARTVFDPAPACRVDAEFFRLSDFVTPNQTELMALTGVDTSGGSLEAAEAGARELLALGAGAVIVKLGADGALWVEGERAVHAPGFPVAAVDTTGAGDCFNAAFATALSRGDTTLAAIRFACAAAAVSVTRAGAQSSMPTLREVQELLETAGPDRGSSD